MNLQKSQHQSAEQAQQKSSPQLKKFQRLTEKLKQEKQRLVEWQAAKQEMQQRAQRELNPLYAQLRQIKYEQVLMLVRQMNKKFTPAQYEKLEDKIISMAIDLIRSQKMSAEQVAILKDILLECGMPDDALNHPIFAHAAKDSSHDNDGECDGDDREGCDTDCGSTEGSDTEGSDTGERQSESQTDTEQDYDQQAIDIKIENIKHTICLEYGVEMDFFDFDYDPSNLEDFLDRLKEKILAYQEQQILDQFDGYAREQAQREMQREKAKHAKKLQQRAEAKKIANQSIKTIYSKLAAMIHPDRERDEQKKDEKTALFQQLNQAYASKDLFALLEFQAGLGQINQKNLATQQLKAYNLILEEQLEQVDDQIEEIIECFDWGDDHDVDHGYDDDSYGFGHGYGKQNQRKHRKIKALHHKFEQDLKMMQQHLEHVKQISLYYQDIKMIKQMMRSRELWEMH